MTTAELELLHELLAVNRTGPELTLVQRRERYERADAAFADLIELPPAEPPVRIADAAGVWVRRARTDRPVVLYLHGGSYTMGSPRSHRHLAHAIGSAADASVLVLDYRRPPEAPFPAAVDDAVAAYHYLRATTPIGRITLAGDSAGAGLALALLQRLRATGDPLPVATACLSPWTDLSCSAPSHSSHADRDPVLDPADLRIMAGLYLGGADPADPLASPRWADLTGLPPLLIQVGSEEILRDDASTLDSCARTAGVSTVFEEWPGMFHVWHYYYPILSEGEAAIATVGAFLSTHGTTH